MSSHSANNRELTFHLSILTIVSLGLIIFGVRIHLIDGLATSMPYWDDWGMAGFLNNYVSGEIGFTDFFTPVNEHRMVFNRLISVIVFELNQRQWDPIILMIINSGIWTLTGVLLLTVAKLNQQKINTSVFLMVILAIWLYPVSPVNALWGIQTHNYMMILLGVSACWFINQRFMTLWWWLGAACMFTAGLSMAGGSFAAIAITIVFALSAIIDKENRRTLSISAGVAACAAIFGLGLIATQSQSGAPQEIWNFGHSLLTFSKSMSFPLVREAWPFFIFVLPILFLLKEVIAGNSKPSSLVRFTLCLYLFVVLLALAIAVARAFEGQGPSRRYLEFLALAQIASLLALSAIQNTLAPALRNSLIVAWVAAMAFSLPFQIEVLRYTLEDRNNTIPYQTENMHRFIYQNDAEALLDQPFRHVPFHNGQRLAEALVEFERNDIMPYQLQKAVPLIAPGSSTSVFIPNGSYLLQSKVAGVDYNGAPMLGSYHSNDVENNGMAVIGEFESAPFKLTRPYMMLPTLGLLGLDKLSLNLINTDTNVRRALIPENAGLDFSDEWLENFYAVEPGTYKLVADDQNPDFWFGFATPRSVGRLSYLAQQILERASQFWQLGLILLVFAQRKYLIKIFIGS